MAHKVEKKADETRMGLTSLVAIQLQRFNDVRKQWRPRRDCRLLEALNGGQRSTYMFQFLYVKGTWGVGYGSGTTRTAMQRMEVVFILEEMSRT